jgi:hypothetical protein
MRRVPLCSVDLYDANDRFVGPLDYADAYIQVSKMPQGGITGDEMDTPLSIESAIRTARSHNADSVLLEDAQWQWLCDRVKSNRWPYASKTFKDLIEAVLGAELVDPNIRMIQ